MTLAGGSPILAGDLNTEQDAQRAALNGVIAAGVKPWTFRKRALQLSSTTAMLNRSMEFIPSDDWELIAFGVNSQNATAGTTLVATLDTPDDTDNTFLLGAALTAQVVAGITPYLWTQRSSYETSTGTRLWLLRGVKYRISVSSTDASPPSNSWVEATVACRSRLRER